MKQIIVKMELIKLLWLLLYVFVDDAIERKGKIEWKRNRNAVLNEMWVRKMLPAVCPAQHYFRIQFTFLLIICCTMGDNDSLN